MLTHPRRSHRLAIAAAIAGTLAGGVLAGPAMAAGDGGGHGVITPRKAGGHEVEYLMTPRKAGGKNSIIAVRKAGGHEIEYLITPRKAGGHEIEYFVPGGYIIAI
jgi:hypothetical protein